VTLPGPAVGKAVSLRRATEWRAGRGFRCFVGELAIRRLQVARFCCKPQDFRLQCGNTNK